MGLPPSSIKITDFDTCQGRSNECLSTKLLKAMSNESLLQKMLRRQL